MALSLFTLPVLTSGILIILFIFIFIISLLLIISLKAKINWKLKFLLIALSTFVYVGVYQGMMSFAGWPSEQMLPEKFQIHWTYIREPNKFSGSEGAIYMWIEELDEYNVPFGIPRSFKLPYTPPLEEEIAEVQDNIQNDIEQSASIKKLTQAELDLYNEKNRESTLSPKNKESSGHQSFESLGGVFQITFGELEGVELPEKSPF